MSHAARRSYAAGIIYGRPMRCRWQPRRTKTRTAFVTNDIQLRRVADEIDIVILDEFF